MDIETARIIGLEKSKEIVEKIEIRKKHSPNLKNITGFWKSYTV